MGKVLIIDDDKMFCETMAALVEQMGHDVVKAFTQREGLEQAVSIAFDVVLLDVQLPDGSGLDLLPELKKTAANPEVIIITGIGDPDGAELAIKTGAWDYIEKTASTKKMTLPLVRAMKYREEKATKTPRSALKREGIIGNSLLMKSCLDLLAQASESDTNVLITGETGTGKELFSRAIHANSARFNQRFVVVDCAALPETLVESTLFGHIKGAFTGAEKDQDGLIKEADGGTLLLDEIGELPYAVQRAFLRVLQERSFRPVGASREIKSDFRLITATNRDLDEMVDSGLFRKDLLFRIRTLTIDLPALREHSEDIKDIALYYISKLCERHQLGTKGVSPDFFDKICSYNWPGNVRDLINALETAVSAAGQDHTLMPIHLPAQIRIHSARTSVSKQEPSDSGSGKNDIHPMEPPNFRNLMETTEQKYFQDLIDFTQGDIKASCRLAGLSRSRLYALMKKHNISRKY